MHDGLYASKTKETKCFPCKRRGMVSVNVIALGNCLGTLNLNSRPVISNVVRILHRWDMVIFWWGLFREKVNKYVRIKYYCGVPQNFSNNNVRQGLKLVGNHYPRRGCLHFISRRCLWKIHESLCFPTNYLWIDFSLSFSLSTNPSTRAGYDIRSIFKRRLTGLNSEFSFS